jgi:hypothetical protein
MKTKNQTKSTKSTNINKTSKVAAFFRAKLDKGVGRDKCLIMLNKSLQLKPNYLTKAGVLCVLDTIATYNGPSKGGDDSAA